MIPHKLVINGQTEPIIHLHICEGQTLVKMEAQVIIFEVRMEFVINFDQPTTLLRALTKLVQ